MPSVIDEEFGRITLRRSAKASHVRIRVAPDGRLRASLPLYAPTFLVKRLIRSSRDQLRAMLAEQNGDMQFEHGMQIGKSHTLISRPTTASKASAARHGQQIIVSLPAAKNLEDPDVTRIVRDTVIEALRIEAKSYLTKRLSYLAQQGEFSYEKVRFSHASGRWGSCSSSGTISLNIALMKLPFELIDYVLVHELSHTIHMNHSTEFWEVVETVDPQYKLHRRNLKKRRLLFENLRRTCIMISNMQRGGAVINQRTAQVMRFAGLIMPVILLLYGILVKYGLADNSHYAGDAVFLVLMVPWVLLAFVQFVYPSTTWKSSGIRFAIYHLLSAVYVLFVSGFATPFIATWVLLILAAYAYFSGFGLRLSILFFILVAETDSLVHASDGSILLTNALALASVLIVGVTAVAIARIQEIDGAELSRSKALESLQRDRILTIVNNLADAVLSTDEDGIVRVYNAASLNLLDTNVSLNGHHIDEILKLYEAKDKPVSLYEQLQQSRSVVIRDDLTMPLEDETLRLEITYSPIRNSYSRSKKAKPQDGYIVILRDVTKAKSLEEERDEFISVVSHELRTPITIAEGTISNVQVMMDRPNIAPDILKEAIDTAHDQVIFLSKMVNDLSTLSRAERGVADAPETIEVRGLVDDLYNEYSPQAEAKKLHFNLDLGTRLGEISASRLYLKELLQNFVTNAIKYTKEGSITLVVKREDNTITFEVKDTGIGISKSDQTKIFNKFYRSEDYRTRETSGTGLGLYVAVKLAKKLGTKIKYKSRLNHGSSFSITLPTIEEKVK